MERPNGVRVGVFLLLAVGGCAVDLWSKRRVFEWLGMPFEREPYWLIDETFGFQTSLNEGALFGMGQGLTMVFAGLSVLAAAGIVYWLLWGGATHDGVLTCALGCVTAGIFGNLYDRLGFPGLKWHVYHRDHAIGDPVYAVRDFIQFDIKAWNFSWATFNVADSLLVCGAGLLILHAVLDALRKPAAASPSANPAAKPPA